MLSPSAADFRRRTLFLLPLEARLLTGLAIAIAVVYWTTPIAIRVADRLDFHDKPRGYRGHTHSTPYLGGAALITGFVVALLLFAADLGRTAPVVAGVLVLWVVGTWDDRREIAWWLRVIVELGLATMLWATGYGWDLGFGGSVDLLMTAFWVVAVVNAFNLFDNMDGQSATMGLVTSIGLAALGIAIGDAWLAVAGTALAGACFGFLPHNLLAQPARIFLGDGGSMPLGFAVASLAMIGAAEAAPAWQALALGLLFVGIPALDTTLVVVSRKRRGISVLTGGRDHLTHRARQRLRTAFAVAIALGSAQVVLSLLAVAASRGSTIVLAGVAVVYLIALGVAVALIDSRLPAVPAGSPAPSPAGTVRARPAHLAAVPREAPLLVILGLGAGLSPLFSGFYDASVWGPIGLGLLVTVLAVGIARPPQLGRWGWIALAALTGYGLWALTSALWADSSAQAFVEGNRTLALAALLGLMLLLVRDRRSALWAIGAFMAGAVLVELIVLFRLLGPGAAEQFLGGRLDQPLGYINAQATFAILALWPLLAIAEQRRSAVAAGAGMSGVVLMSGLTLLSQSRGAALAVAGSLLVVLAVAPGRMRRACALVVAGAAVAFAAQALLDITDPTTNAAVHRAATVLLAFAIAAGLIWGLAVAAERSLADASRATAKAVVAGGLVVCLAAGLGLAALNAGTVRGEVRAQYDAFVTLGVAEGGEQTASRLLTGAGNRYDYWRIAGRTWEQNKVLGVGAGNYDEPYFIQRSTVEDIRQPHSMLLQGLSELGILGFALVLVFLGAALWAGVRWAPAARASRTERGLLVAALGSFTAWAVHTQVDWIHLLPGITAGALIAAAVLLRPPASATSRAPRSVTARAALAGLIVLPLAVAGVSLSRQALASHHRGEAQQSLRQGDPRAAISSADSALRLDDQDLQTYYVKSAAFARLGDAKAAERVLQQAVAVEPGDFLPYALLGDLSVRRRQFAKATDYYRQSAARNPREPALAALVKNPRAAAP